MASSSPPVRPARYLTLFFVLLIGVYLLVFLTGDEQAKPKLGIDLQGGTRVTLTARTPDGSKPSRESLNQAQQIISARVNGLGVSGSEVVIDGDNLVITVPGTNGSEARNLGQTARLYIRPVIDSVPIPPAGQSAPGEPDIPGPPQGEPGAPPPAPAPGAPAEQPPAPGEAPPAAPPPSEPAQPGQPAPQPRPYPQDPPPPSPPPAPPNPAPAPAPGQPPPGSPAPPPGAPAPAPSGAPSPNPQDLANQIKREQLIRQTPALEQLAALGLMRSRCEGPDVLAGNDDPTKPLVTCSKDKKQIYILEPSIISGDQIAKATSGFDQQGSQWVVNVTFKSAAEHVG